MSAKKKSACLPQAISKTVPLNQLRSGDAINARRTGRDTSLDELKASILAHGVVQSLRVRLAADNTHYEVIAGNRRLLALQGLLNEGKIEPDYSVPVIAGVIDDAAAHELSVVENVERVPVSAVDEFRAFARVHAEGKSVDEVAERFGVPIRRVQQRLKLAALHPDILHALEEGKITLDAAAAFTVQSDPDRQAAYLREAIESQRTWLLQPRDIRHAMTETHLAATSPLAKLIGETAYVAAGGEIVTDLFAELVYWTSGDIVERLTRERFAEQEAAWLADGWAWVAHESEYSNIWNYRRHYPKTPALGEADQARCDALEAAIDEMEDAAGDAEPTAEQRAEYTALAKEIETIRARYLPMFTAEEKAGSGVVYYTNGEAVFGVIDTAKAGAEPAGAPETGKKQQLPPEDPAAVGANVSQTLSLALSDSLRTEIGADPDLALPLLAAFMAASQNGKQLPAHMSLGHATAGRTADSKHGITEAFRYFDEMDDETLLASIARMFANSVDVSDSFLGSKYMGAATQRSLIEELVEIVEPRDFPEFDTIAYFEGVKKPLIAAAFKEITGEAIKDGKKADMAATTAKLAMEHGWLPVALRSKAYDGPGAAANLQEAAE
ncbi:MAG TPA: ParB/RepB/Spo0J family partition protein [Devosia sp.]|jgi:ParB family chromosome partitioning protein|nr:ParB/RepB/Spo0J family partition protein [Devosia sp.]